MGSAKCEVRSAKKKGGSREKGQVFFSPERAAEHQVRIQAREAFGNLKRRVQARFSHSGSEYRLWVTDPGYERKYLAQPDGDHLIGDCFITVSLGEPFNDASYKLVAAILERLP